MKAKQNEIKIPLCKNLNDEQTKFQAKRITSEQAQMK